VFSFVLVEPAMPSWFSIAADGFCSFRRVLAAANETFGSGVAAGSGTFCRLCFLADGPDFEVEEADLSFTEAFLLRPGVNSEACSDDGSLLGARAGFPLPAVV
jgi:hypothetical protein